MDTFFETIHHILVVSMMKTLVLDFSVIVSHELLKKLFKYLNT